MNAPLRDSVQKESPKPSTDYVGFIDEAKPSRWAVKNQHLRECLAEFFGTWIMIAFGMAVNNQVGLSGEKDGTFLSINLSWGIAIMLAVHATEGVSGSDLNPAVSVTKAVFGRLAWWKVPGYCVAQLLGAFVGAWCIFLLHKNTLDAQDPERTAATFVHFATHPAAHITHATACYTEFLGTAMLTLGIFALTDKKNRPASPFALPINFFLLIAAIGMSFGMNTGYALNPARDLGPRLMLSMAGWGSQVFTAYDYYFWIPLIAPFFGGVAGGVLYKGFIEIHHPQQTLPQ